MKNWHTTNVPNYALRPNFLTESEIERTKERIDDLPFVKAEVSGSPVYQPDHRNCDVAGIIYTQDIYLHDKIHDEARIINRKLWKLDINKHARPLIGAMRYAEGQFFRSHKDKAEDNERALSITVCLREDSGCLAIEGEDVPLQAGDMVVFPSDVAHEVKTVTSGIRESLVLWINFNS